MKTKAVRLYGENDLRLEEFDLPELKNGEILIKIVSDSVCMSTYKTAKQHRNMHRQKHASYLRDLAGYKRKNHSAGKEHCAKNDFSDIIHFFHKTASFFCLKV